MDNDYLYGSKNMPVESNFEGATFSINGSSYRFVVKSCMQSGDFYNIADEQDNVIQVPVREVEDLFSGKTIDNAVLVGHGPVNLTLASASKNSHIQKYMDDPDRAEFGGAPMGLDEVKDFDLVGWMASNKK